MGTKWPSLRFLFRKRVRVTSSRRTQKVKISDGELLKLWISLREVYFPDRIDIDSYQVYWSSRKQKRVLASCNIKRRCICVARELNDPSHEKWLSPLLYHEMCHAIIGEGVAKSGRKKLWHGAEFKRLEARHPEICTLDRWMRTGGWLHAVRSDRARRSAQVRRLRKALPNAPK